MAAVPIVVFVCEHGAAKSVIAAAYFNRLALDRSLDLHAIGRGTAPVEKIPKNVIRGLQADGLNSNVRKPERFTGDDLAGAIRIVAFCDLPKEQESRVPIELWKDVPPVSEGYKSSCNIIFHHVSKLLDELTGVRGV